MVDVFSIVSLVGGALLLIFIAVSAYYFYSVWNNQIPLTTQSSAMFWFSIIWAALVFGFCIWAFVRLIKGVDIYKPDTCEEEMKECETRNTSSPPPAYFDAYKVESKYYAPPNPGQGFGLSTSDNVVSRT